MQHIPCLKDFMLKYVSLRFHHRRTTGGGSYAQNPCKRFSRYLYPKPACLPEGQEGGGLASSPSFALLDGQYGDSSSGSIVFHLGTLFPNTEYKPTKDQSQVLDIAKRFTLN
jgi:hypothetical protein